MDAKVLVSSFSIIAQADAIRRFSRDQVVKEETVLQHIGWVALWCLFAGEMLEARGVRVNYGRLLRRAVLHDLDEVGTGDIPRVTKYASPEIRHAMAEVELHSVKWIEHHLGLDGKLSHEWLHAKGPDTVEGRLLKYADLVACVYKVWDEIIRNGNFAFARVAYEVWEHTQTMLGGNARAGPAAAWFDTLNLSLLQILEQAISLIPSDAILGPNDLSFSVERKDAELAKV